MKIFGHRIVKWICVLHPRHILIGKNIQKKIHNRYKKYPTKDEWLNGFLLETIDKCHYGLKPGGHMLLNVANTARIKNFEDETLRLAKMIHFKHIDTWYLQLATQEGEHKREPIFIFQK